MTTPLEVLIDAKLAGTKHTRGFEVDQTEAGDPIFGGEATYAFRSNEQAAQEALDALAAAGYEIVECMSAVDIPEPKTTYVIVTGSDGSFVWYRESLDHWRQKDGPSWAWNVLVHAARERKWTIDIPTPLPLEP